MDSSPSKDMHSTKAPADPKPKKPESKLRSILSVVVVFVVVFAAFGLSRYLQAQNEKLETMEDRPKVFAPMVEDDNPILVYFKEQFPEYEILLACQEDVTNDQLEDLLVIWRYDGNTRLTVVCTQADGSYTMTEPIKAPIENQGIQFKDIDHKDEMEFIVSGEKKGQAGYAIYRMIDGQPTDLFGDGMADCC